MTLVRRTKKGKLIVPGEWEVHTPTVGSPRDDVRIRTMVEVLTSIGAPPLRAEEVARRGVSLLFRGRWRTATIQHVQRAAEMYNESFGSLEGFKPQMAERIYIPHAKDVWGAGGVNHLLRRTLKEMREK